VSKLTKNGRTQGNWIAKFYARNKFGAAYEVVRLIVAVSEFQAMMKAEGIAEANKWKVVSVERSV
jgi:hypothetical protein